MPQEIPHSGQMPLKSEKNRLAKPPECAGQRKRPSNHSRCSFEYFDKLPSAEPWKNFCRCHRSQNRYHRILRRVNTAYYQRLPKIT